MAARLEATRNIPDVVKWVVALAVLAGAIVVYYLYPEHSLLLRVIGVLAAAGVAGAILFYTEKGRVAWAFMRDARTEVRKVVWPTRKETVQTTVLVITVVAVVAVILWLIDGLLTYLVRLFIGG